MCTKIVLTEQGVAESYNGNYRTHLEQKKQVDELRMRDHDAQQKQIKALKNEINDLRPQGESASQAIKAKARTPRPSLSVLGIAHPPLPSTAHPLPLPLHALSLSL